MDPKQLKAKFDLDYAEVLESGALRLVYDGEASRIYSLGERMYGLVFMEKLVENNSKFLMIALCQNDLKKIIKNEKIIYPLLQKRMNLPNGITAIGPEQVECMKRWYAEYLEKGTTEINLEAEQRLLEKTNKRKR